MIEEERPTVLLDEADTFIHENSEMRGIINAMFNRNGQASRMEKGADGKFHRRIYKLFSPLCVAMIRLPNPTIVDRSIVLNLQRKRGGNFERLRHKAAFPEIVRQLVRWADDNAEQLSAIEPVLPPQLDDRAQDKWESLLAIAESAGPQWLKKAQTAALALTDSRLTDDDLGGMALEDCLRVFYSKLTDGKPPELLAADDLVIGLNAMLDRVWPDLDRRNGLTQHKLTGLLKSFGLYSKRGCVDGKQKRGYEYGPLRQVCSQYLAADVFDEITKPPISIAPDPASEPPASDQSEGPDW